MYEEVLVPREPGAPSASGDRGACLASARRRLARPWVVGQGRNRRARGLHRRAGMPWTHAMFAGPGGFEQLSGLLDEKGKIGWQGPAGSGFVTVARTYAAAEVDAAALLAISERNMR